MGRKTRAQKYRHEKRRITRRRQRGGAVENIEAWIAAVTASPAFAKATDEFKPDADRKEEALRLGAYHFSDLKRDELQMPDLTEYSTAFDLDAYAGAKSDQKTDIRQEAAAAAELLRDVISANPTPYEFKKYIEQLKQAGLQEEIQGSLVFLADLEEKMRKSVSTDPNEAIKILEDETKYPLYLWALVMNLPAKPVEPALTLVPTTPSVTAVPEQKVEKPQEPAVPEAQAS
jgi:hypothetical protein